MAENTTPHGNEPKIEPIYDEVCEQAVLGCLMIDRDTIATVSRILGVDDFHLTFHRFVYQIMLDMWGKREPCDFVTFSSEFWRRIRAMDQRDVDALNMPTVPESYIAECVTIANYTAVHAEYYARRVLDFADRNRLAAASLKGIEGAYRTDSDMDLVVEETAAATRDSRRMPPSGRYMAIGDIPERDTRIPRVHIGGPFTPLDTLTGGFEPGQMIVVAARPSVGKSAIVLQWLHTFTKRTGRPTGLISLEMGRADVVDRVIGIESGVNMHAWRSMPTAAENHAVDEARLTLASMPLMIDDDADTGLTAVVARAKAMAMEQKIVMLGIDYLQLMQVNGRNDNRVQEVSRISAAMKQLARELAIPVVVLAQLNRGVEFRPDAEPKISDLRDSGAIEQDADIVLLLHRVNEEGAVKLIVGKNRNGPVGWVDMQFQKRTASFSAKGEQGAAA